MITRVSMLTVMEKHNGNWFTEGAMSFFDSVIEPYAYSVGDSFFFVSSERCRPNKRRWSIRKQHEGMIRTHGDFQAYASLKAANKALNAVLDEELLKQG